MILTDNIPPSWSIIDTGSAFKISDKEGGGVGEGNCRPVQIANIRGRR
jgi:hypothetical protein